VTPFEQMGVAGAEGEIRVPIRRLSEENLASGFRCVSLFVSQGETERVALREPTETMELRWPSLRRQLFFAALEYRRERILLMTRKLGITRGADTRNL